MKPVNQTQFGAKGNCFSAAVASILELPIAEVPFFMDADPWWPPFAAWCEERGVVPTYRDRVDGEPPPRGYTIQCGLSPRDPEAGHAVVARDGVMVHDPNPSRMGLVEVWGYVTLERVHIGSPGETC